MNNEIRGNNVNRSNNGSTSNTVRSNSDDNNDFRNMKASVTATIKATSINDTNIIIKSGNKKVTR